MSDKQYDFRCFGKVYRVTIRPGHYAGGRLALELIDFIGAPVAKVTVNIPEEYLEEGEILVKTWAENEPMADFLIANGIAEDTGQRVPCGGHGAEAWVMRLLAPVEGR